LDIKTDGIKVAREERERSKGFIKSGEAVKEFVEI